jgi:PmbA protein
MTNSRLDPDHPFFHDQQRCLEITARALQLAREGGADAAEASAGVATGCNVTVRMGEVDTLQHSRDRSLGVTVYVAGRKGSASSSDFSPEALGLTVDAALAAARHTEADPYAGLVEPELLAQEWQDLDLYHPWDWTPDWAIEAARAVEAAGRSVDPRLGNSDGASLSWGSGLQIYGNSHGFLGGYPTSRGSVSCTLIGKDDAGMQRDGWYAMARAPEDLPPLESIGQIAGARTVARLSARRIPTCTTPVIFEAPIAASLIGHFIAAISGVSLYRRTSFLLDRLGTAVFPDFLSIEEAPHLLRGLGSAPFDGDGVATRPRALIDAGVLKGLVLSGYSARRLGLVTTGNAGGVHNLLVTPGQLDLTQLMQRMGRGLLVTDLLGFGVNAVTGDYSRGAAGFWIEDGAIAYPVEEITIAGNLKDMYLGIEAVGSDVDTRGRTHCGSILIDRMTVAGSEAT